MSYKWVRKTRETTKMTSLLVEKETSLPSSSLPKQLLPKRLLRHREELMSQTRMWLPPRSKGKERAANRSKTTSAMRPKKSKKHTMARRTCKSSSRITLKVLARRIPGRRRIRRLMCLEMRP